MRVQGGTRATIEYFSPPDKQTIVEFTLTEGTKMPHTPGVGQKVTNLSKECLGIDWYGTICPTNETAVHQTAERAHTQICGSVDTVEIDCTLARQ